MKKLHTYFKLLSFILLISASAAQGMEMTVSQQTPVSPLTEVPSLQNICLNYIGDNAHKTDLIENMVWLPAELAVKTIVSANDTYITKRKTSLTRLASSADLDTEVSCTIAEKYQDVGLAYELAKSGPITDGVASLIIDDFLATDIVTCLSDFNSAFNQAFPKEILNHGNNDCLYMTFIKKIPTAFKKVTFINNWATNDADNALLSAQDFNQKKSIEDIAHYITKKNFICENFNYACTNGLVALSPCKNFLAYSIKSNSHWNTDYTTIEIHSLNPRTHIKILNPSKTLDTDTIAFSKDGSHFGVLDKSGNIQSVEIATALNATLFQKVSLSEIASLAYCINQSQVKDFHAMTKNIVFNNVMSYEEEMLLMQFIKDNILSRRKSFPVCSFPMYLRKDLEKWISNLNHEQAIMNLFYSVSEALHMTNEEIINLWFVNRDQKFVDYVFETFNFSEEAFTLTIDALDLFGDHIKAIYID
ncbi:MAG TPA: hypothetical protein VJ201_04505 [Candidatus Babeliales bacterium]|nr:hypothetical protein [Candidatus Babeliales bacterium]